MPSELLLSAMALVALPGSAISYVLKLTAVST